MLTDTVPLACSDTMFIELILKAPFTTKLVCFFRQLKCIRSLLNKKYSVDPVGAAWSASTLFVYTRVLVNKFSIYVQQTT